MSAEGDAERPLGTARESGLLPAAGRILVLLSGGADSVCLLDVAIRLGARAEALHVNYGLRDAAAADEASCRELCDRLEIPLIVERVQLQATAGTGNLQAEARDARYALAERHASGDYAAAHTASDQAETVLYRLAVSPGRRALLGMAPRRDRLVRPLLAATAADTRAYCHARELPWVEDASNTDPRFARTRVRQEVLPVLRTLNPSAELAIAETARLLRDEDYVLERAVDELLERSGTAAVPIDALRSAPPALARLAIRRLAEIAARTSRPVSREAAEEVMGLASSGGSGALDLGGGVRAIVEYGVLRFQASPDAGAPEPTQLPVPGRVRFGEWEVEARLGSAGEAVVSAAALGASATVRARRPGDRMRPAGLGGTKSLQDLLTDRKVPRGLRDSLPVIEAGGRIAWVAGVATDERFRPNGGETIALSARRSGGRRPPAAT